MNNRLFGNNTFTANVRKRPSDMTRQLIGSREDFENKLRKWPLATIGVGLGFGIVLGWWVKRR